jgi:hypothetical protein
MRSGGLKSDGRVPQPGDGLSLFAHLRLLRVTTVT